MEIWEETDEQRIAVAQARWAAESLKLHPFPGSLWRRRDQLVPIDAGTPLATGEPDGRCWRRE